MSKKSSQKFDDAGEERTPGHSRKKSPIEKKLDGIAAGVRVLTDKLAAQSKAKAAEIHDETVGVKLRELEPWLDAARVALDQMAEVQSEVGSAVAAVVAMDVAAIQRLLPIAKWPMVHAVYNEGKAPANLLMTTPSTLRLALKIATDLTPNEIKTAWG